MRWTWPPRCVRDLQDSLCSVHSKLDQMRLQLNSLERRVHQLVDKETHEAEVLAAIQGALEGVDLPPGKLEAINAQVQQNIAKLRGAIDAAGGKP